MYKRTTLIYIVVQMQNNTQPKKKVKNISPVNTLPESQSNLIQEAFTNIENLNQDQHFKNLGIASQEKIQAITESLNKIKETNLIYDNRTIISLIWSLSKIRYYEEDLLLRYKSNILNGMHSINESSFVKLLQSMATLTLFDAEILSACLDKLQYLHLDSTGKSSSAYYMSMILTNSLKDNTHNNLAGRMRNSIADLITSIPEAERDHITIRQIFDINSAGIITLQKNKLKLYKNTLKNKKEIVSSKVQEEVCRYIENTYIGSKVENEFYDELMCASRDLKLSINEMKISFYIEVDGVHHYFINQSDMQDGSTLFRNNIYRIVHNDDLVIIPAITNNSTDIAVKILEQVNTRISNIRTEREQADLANLKAEEPILELVHSANEPEEAIKNNTSSPTKTNNQKRKQKKKENKDLNAMIESAIVENTKNQDPSQGLNEISYNDMLKRYKSKNLPDLLKKISRSRNLEDFKLISDYKKDSAHIKLHAKTLLHEEMSGIEELSGVVDNATLKRVNMLLDYADSNENHAQYLISSIKYGFTDLLGKILDIHLKNREYEDNFIELLIYMNLAHNRIDIAEFLLNKYSIDINSDHNFTDAFTIKVLFANLNDKSGINSARLFLESYFNSQDKEALKQALKKYQKGLLSYLEMEKKITILGASILSNSYKAIHWLLDKGATCDITKYTSNSAKYVSEAFHFTGENDTRDIYKVILQSCLTMHISKNLPTMKEQVFDFIPKEIEASDGATGLSPLHILAMTDHTDVIPYLNTVGFDVNQELKKAAGNNRTHLAVKVIEKEKEEAVVYQIPYGATPASLILKNNIISFSKSVDKGTKVDFTAFNSHLGCSILEYCQNEKPSLYSNIMNNHASEIDRQLRNSLMIITMPDLTNPSCNPENTLTQTTLSTRNSDTATVCNHPAYEMPDLDNEKMPTLEH